MTPTQQPAEDTSDRLEQASFALEGVAEMLRALSTAEQARHVHNACDLLASVTERTVQVINRAVEELYAEKRVRKA